MNMLTCVVVCSAEECVGMTSANEEIESKRAEGWYLRGTPVYTGDPGLFLLTFEKPEFDEVMEADTVFDDVQAAEEARKRREAEETDETRGGDDSNKKREYESDFFSY